MAKECGFRPLSSTTRSGGPCKTIRARFRRTTSPPVATFTRDVNTGSERKSVFCIAASDTGNRTALLASDRAPCLLCRQ